MIDNHLPQSSPRPLAAFLCIAAAALVIVGCGNNNTAAPAKMVPLTLKASGTGAPAAGAHGARGISASGALISQDGDTIPVTFTSAYLVVRDVRFKISDDGSTDSTDIEDGGESDSTGAGETDSTDVGDDDHGDGDHDSAGMVRFNGPFVIDLLNQTSQTLDTEMVPPGVYRRVQGHLAALRAGNSLGSDFDFLIGSTVYLQGTVDGEDGGPFTYSARIDNEFMIRGAFTVQTDTPATAFITFDVSEWLTGRDGQFLDPRVQDNDKWIKWAIRHSIKVGMDDDHDGEIDDHMHGSDD
jgi:hypothetical protein